jgi:hypothetical protein
MTDSPHTHQSRTAPGLGVAPSALLFLLLADEPEHRRRPARSKRRFRLLRRS